MEKLVPYKFVHNNDCGYHGHDRVLRAAVVYRKPDPCYGVLNIFARTVPILDY